MTVNLPAPTAVEIIPNRGWSPIGTPQRHYKLGAPVEFNGAAYSNAVVVTGLKPGEAYLYPAADAEGEIADWFGPVKVETGGDVAALAALGYQIVGPVPINS